MQNKRFISTATDKQKKMKKTSLLFVLVLVLVAMVRAGGDDDGWLKEMEKAYKTGIKRTEPLDHGQPREVLTDTDTAEDTEDLQDSQTTAGVLQSSVESKNGVTFTYLVFCTDQVALNGLFYGELVATARNPDNMPIVSISEKIFLKVHEKGNKGPFPDGFVSVEFNEAKTEVNCTERPCRLACTSYGNDLKAVAIYKEDANGTRRDLGATVDGSKPFHMLAVLRMDPANADTAGRYVCRASLKASHEVGVNVTAEIVLLRM
ncbi:hypothetical protein ACOMHN_027660 [Nucella lapillus]